MVRTQSPLRECLPAGATYDSHVICPTGKLSAAIQILLMTVSEQIYEIYLLKAHAERTGLTHSMPDTPLVAQNTKMNHVCSLGSL